MILFVHGASLTGKAAWPGVDRADAVYADLSGLATLEERASAIAASITEPTTIVAHSIGAVAAVLALASIRDEVARLILIEPALYDVARGNVEIERHIEAMDEAHALAAAGDFAGFWAIVRPLMFGGKPDPAQWESERGWVEWFASVPRPWGYALSAADLAGIPTTVITGAWNAEYEAIADALGAVGAVQIHLVGHDHRPQDHSDFASRLEDLLRDDG